MSEQPTTPTPDGAGTHTPLPWNLHRAYEGELMAVPEGGGVQAFVAASLVIARGEQIIAEVKMASGLAGRGFPQVESEAEMRGNAALILTACNAHPHLAAQVADLTAKVEALDTECDRLILGRDDAEEACDKLTSAVLGEPIDWPDHQGKWAEALEEAQHLVAQNAELRRALGNSVDLLAHTLAKLDSIVGDEARDQETFRTNLANSIEGLKIVLHSAALAKGGAA